MGPGLGLGPDADHAAAGAAIAAALDARFPGGRVGVAVSGGSDSTGLLLAVHRWAHTDPAGGSVIAATVNHGLRPEARAEADGIGALCARLGIKHDILTWAHDGAPRGNLAAAARDARRALLAEWARAAKLDAVLLGHTIDDQAETVLLRLARGSGVDGLSAMASETRAHGAVFARPALDLRRSQLRAICIAHGVGWVDDPTNADLSHHRPRARAALAALAPLGIDAAGLAATARRLQSQRAALEASSAALLAQALRWGGAGEAWLALAPLARAPLDLRLRALAAGIAAISGARRPRQRALAPLAAALVAGWGEGRDDGEGGREVGAPAATLAGVMFVPRGPHHVALCREPTRAAPPCDAPPGAVWDGRWRIEGAPPPGARLGPLGPEGLRDPALAGCPPPPGWAAAPRAARLTAPCLRLCGTLIFAPHAGYINVHGGMVMRDLRADGIFADDDL